MKTRSFSLDLPADVTRAPRPGDVIVSARRVLRVVEARPVESRVWCNRWRVTYEQVGTATAHVPDGPAPTLADGSEMSTTSCYRKGETPAQFFGSLEVAR